MDPIRNPYAPGAGTRPPEMVGLRGVGKTVLLDQIAEDAEASGIDPIHVVQN